MFESSMMMLMAFIVAVVAGVVRGATGFGFSAIVVASLAPWVVPAPLVASVLLVEIVASLLVFRSMQPYVSVDWLKRLSWANFFGVPIGVFVLTGFPTESVRLAVAVAILLSVVSNWFLKADAIPNTKTTHYLAGIAAGVLNGLSASGGIVAALVMTLSGQSATTIRSTMSAYLLLAALYTVVLGFVSTVFLMGGSASSWLALVLSWLLVLIPGLLIGGYFGGILFKRLSNAQFRKAMLLLIGVIASSAIFLALKN